MSDIDLGAMMRQAANAMPKITQHQLMMVIAESLGTYVQQTQAVGQMNFVKHCFTTMFFCSPEDAPVVKGVIERMNGKSPFAIMECSPEELLALRRCVRFS